MSYVSELKKSILTQRLVVLTCIGTLIHWFDFYISSAVIPLIINKYFVTFSESALILSLMGSLIGFFIRPLGAIFLGGQIDLLGRKTFFVKSLNLTATSTLFIALFPFAYANAYLGVAVLMISRILQGLALSMEYGSAVSYIYESVPENKTGYFTGLLQSTAPLGFLLSLLSLFICKEIIPQTQFEDWGWRIPLILGVPLILLSGRIRRQLPESEVFQLLKSKGELSTSPLKEIFKFSENRKKILTLIFSISAPQGVAYYLAQNFSFQYIAQKFSLTSSQQSFLTIAIITLSWPIVVYIGRLSDQIDAKLLFKYLLFGYLVIVPSSFYILSDLIVTTDFYWISAVPLFFIYSLSIALYAPAAKILAASFPARLRGLGISIPYHIGNGIFGGVISIFATFQLQSAAGPWFPVLYTVVVLFIALIFLFKESPQNRDISSF